MFIIHEKLSKKYNNNKFKTIAPAWNEKFDLPDGSYSVSDIQNDIKYIIKNMNQ